MSSTPAAQSADSWKMRDTFPCGRLANHDPRRGCSMLYARRLNATLVCLLPFSLLTSVTLASHAVVSCGEEVIRVPQKVTGTGGQLLVKNSVVMRRVRLELCKLDPSVYSIGSL